MDTVLIGTLSLSGLGTNLVLSETAFVAWSGLPLVRVAALLAGRPKKYDHGAEEVASGFRGDP